ncbi:hypothetical protein D8M04_12580 [Oceanobacillus piezotolerans]|uniref:Uncharacterized protein n=1 Tax=Oceanobacillus piezotolerans TaxID=2448030 RepID=A0A498D9Y5_9BACI|nr:hypothetical protein [Oceanobacillus piezotolerans]RLL43750.1 hypothetical protein D8M04_12580 [Oceanobacillus piezotolerans]
MNIDLAVITEEMPDFQHHEEARQWFKDKFKNDFLIRSSDTIDGRKIFFYHIIKNPQVYQKYMESFAKPVNHEITNMETFESYTTVEISEDGDVSIYL